MPVSLIDSPEIRTLGGFLDVSAMRTELITSNLANIDTPGYQTRDINFEQELERELSAGGMQLADFSPVIQKVRGLAARPDGNNVSLEREGMLLAETQLKFQSAVEVLTSEFHRILSAIREGGTSS